MKAVVITRNGPPEVLQLQEVADPRIGDDGVLVRIRAAALNRADLLQRKGLYPAPPGTPQDIPGLEFAGEVESLGEGVADWKKGDRVMGLVPGAGYAEKAACHPLLLLPIPSNLSFEEAACVPEAFLTAYDALFRRLRLSIGEDLLIHAVGSGVGLAALQLAKAAGARVFGTAGQDWKLEKAGSLGLDVAINYQRQDFCETVSASTKGRGVDLILDLVGADYWDRNVRALAEKGRIVLIGLLSGSETSIDLRGLMSKRLQVTGSVLRSRTLLEKADLTAEFRARVLPLLESGKLTPNLDRAYALEDAAAAHRFMEENRNCGKIVLKLA
jgi:putative PIG3 family NAD(P)H quinone oxidoreductase